MNKLTPKQRKFCLEYLKDFNATRAAVEAGYSKKTASVIGTENLGKPNIQDYLAERTRKYTEKAEIDIELILSHLYNMAFFDVKEMLDERGDLLPTSEWPPIAGKLISGMDIKKTIDSKGGETVIVKSIKMPSRERNTENLGRYLAMFTDKIKDVSDPKEMVHYYVPKFRQENEPITFGDNGGDNGDGRGNGQPDND